jgi:hypothetical protein
MPMRVIAGTAVPYGRYLQAGTRRMPARPFLPAADAAAWAPLMQAWLVREARKKGLKVT